MSAIHDEFRDYLTNCYGSMRDGHLAKQPAVVARFFADDVIFFAPDGPPLTGKHEVLRFLGEWYSQVEILEVSHRLLELTLSGEFAFDVCAYTLIYRESSGPVVSEEGHHIVIWRSSPDGVWLISRDMATITKRSTSTSVP